MANRKFTEQGIPQEVRRPEISTSEKIWQAFDKWAAERGYPSLSEAFRAAMIEVTGLNPESQEKKLQSQAPTDTDSQITQPESAAEAIT